MVRTNIWGSGSRLRHSLCIRARERGWGWGITWRGRGRRCRGFIPRGCGCNHLISERQGTSGRKGWGITLGRGGGGRSVGRRWFVVGCGGCSFYFRSMKKADVMFYVYVVDVRITPTLPAVALRFRYLELGAVGTHTHAPRGARQLRARSERPTSTTPTPRSKSHRPHLSRASRCSAGGRGIILRPSSSSNTYVEVRHLRAARARKILSSLRALGWEWGWVGGVGCAAAGPGAGARAGKFDVGQEGDQVSAPLVASTLTILGATMTKIRNLPSNTWIHMRDGDVRGGRAEIRG